MLELVFGPGLEVESELLAEVVVGKNPLELDDPKAEALEVLAVLTLLDPSLLLAATAAAKDVAAANWLLGS